MKFKFRRVFSFGEERETGVYIGGINIYNILFYKFGGG